MGVFLAAFLLCAAPAAWPWGGQGHQMASAAAIRSLPEPLASYFEKRRQFFIAHSSDPDTRAREEPAERPHHYTEAAAFEPYPFPKLRAQFVERGRGPTPEQLQHGDLIWQIARQEQLLERAWRLHREREADHAALFLAHYATDLTQPLHTVTNYDGQMTRQLGLHARFETQLVHELSAHWAPRATEARLLPDIRAAIFEEYLASYRESPLIFAADRLAVDGRTYVDPKYAPAFAGMIGPLAKRQLGAAAALVASLWYTAWVRAGKPDLHRAEAPR